MRALDLVSNRGIPHPASCGCAFSSSSIRKANNDRTGWRIVKEETNNTQQKEGSVMHTRAKEARMRRWATIIVTLISMTVVLVPITQAADEKMTGRVVAHFTKIETMEVGDVPGHVLGIAQQSGLMFISTGEIATKAATLHFDLMKGKGTFVDYSFYTDQDGSTRFLKAVGTVGPVGDGKKFVIEGGFECIGGTGRYEGYKGTGTFKGERIGEIKTGGDAYYDFTMNCKKP